MNFGRTLKQRDLAYLEFVEDIKGNMGTFRITYYGPEKI